MPWPEHIEESRHSVQVNQLRIYHAWYQNYALRYVCKIVLQYTLQLFHLHRLLSINKIPSFTLRKKKKALVKVSIIKASSSKINMKYHE